MLYSDIITDVIYLMLKFNQNGGISGEMFMINLTMVFAIVYERYSQYF